MSRPRLLSRALFPPTIAALALLLTAQSSLASLPTPANGAAWAPNQSLQFRWKEGAEPPGWIRAAILAAAADSNATRDAKAGIFSHVDGARSWIGYTDDLPGNYAIGYAVRSVPDWFTVRLRPHGTVLDWGTLRWCQFYSDPPAGCYDAEMVALHELGHAQTLGHPDEADVDDWLDTVMHAHVKSKAKPGWNAHAWGRCDVARLQIRYEPLNAATPISTCLDVGTQLSLVSPSSGSTYTGESVTFTAHLKIANDSPYPKLASDPLSGRTVLLQRRQPGASTWNTVAEMSSVTNDPGRYVKTVTVNATTEWRVLFQAPASEGLDGSASSMIKLTAVTAPTPTPSPAPTAPPTCPPSGGGSAPMVPIC